MRLFTSNNKNIVAITCSDRELVCAWIEKSPHRSPFMLKAYKQFHLHSYELLGACIFNPSRIQKYINQFLTSYSLSNAACAISVQGSHVQESYVHVRTAAPEAKDFPSLARKNNYCNSTYIGPNDDGTYAFYACAMPRSLLAQYQLMCLSLPITVHVLTTETPALLRLYRYMRGTSFRSAQLNKDLAQVHGDMRALCTRDSMQRMLYAPQASYNASLSVSLGLFLMGNDHA